MARGAGAVVTRDVADYALVVDTPARRIGWMREYGERLPDHSGAVRCSACGKNYTVHGETCRPA